MKWISKMAVPDKPTPERDQPASSQPDLVQLSSEDSLVLDALLEARFGDYLPTEVPTQAPGRPSDAAGPDAAAKQAQTRLRAQKMTAVLGMLDRYSVDPPPSDLLQRTLDRVRESEQRKRFASQIATLSPPTTAFRLSDLVSVAAAVFVAAILALPLLARSEADAKRVACASHQAIAGRGLAHYAAANQQALPRGAVRPNSIWYRVGPGAIDKDGMFQSNSAHIRLLVRQGFVHPNALNCPGNNDAPTDSSSDAPDWSNYGEVSYSYLNQFSPIRIRIDHSPHTPVLADKNPQFEVRILPNGQLKFQHRNIDPDAASVQHGGTGQNVLLKSGAVVWLVKPMSPSTGNATTGDNIFLMKSVRQYRGTEAPDDPEHDVFLTP